MQDVYSKLTGSSSDIKYFLIGVSKSYDQIRMHLPARWASRGQGTAFHREAESGPDG